MEVHICTHCGRTFILLILSSLCVYADPMDIVIPVISSAATTVLLLVIFAIRGKRKNAGNNEERRHLLENGVGGRHVDEVHDPIQESLEELSRPAPIGSSHGKR